MIVVLDGIQSGFSWFIVHGLGTGFDWYTDGITFGVDERTELGFSYIFFEVCHEGMVEGILKVVVDGINDVIGWLIVDCLGPGLMEMQIK